MINSKVYLKVHVDKVLFYLQILSALAWFVVLPMRSVTVRHAVVLVGTISIWLVLLYRFNKYPIKRYTFWGLMILGAIVLIGLIKGEATVDAVYSSLSFLAFFVLGTSTFDDVVDKRMLNSVLAMAVISTGMLWIQFFGQWAHITETGAYTPLLVLGMTNSNFAGIMASNLFLLILVYMKAISIRQWWKKFALMAVLGSLLYLIVQTGTRSCLVTIALPTVYFFFSKKKLPKFFIYIISLVPIVAVPAYLMLFNRVGNFEFLGKTFFSGRQVIYAEHLKNIDTASKIFFGNIAEEAFTNAHNAPLSILCSVGTVGAVVTYVGLIKHLTKENDSISTPVGRMAMICILSCILESSAEVHMLTGGFPGIAFMYIYYILLRYRGTKTVEGDNAIAENKISKLNQGVLNGKY